MLPARFRSLLELTAGERRVLFYLTEGWAAQDIADELVVSLTTVRSHIRSVLRKLEVRSQLAAVAIANSRDLDHPAVGTPPLGRVDARVSPGSGAMPPAARRASSSYSGASIESQPVDLGRGQLGPPAGHPGPVGTQRQVQAVGQRRQAGGVGLGEEHAEHAATRSTASDTSSDGRERVELAQQVAVAGPGRRRRRTRRAAIRRSRSATRPGVSGVSPTTR